MSLLFIAAFSGDLSAKEPQVAASIYPYQQIVNAIVLQPSDLVVDSYISPHNYQLKPSDAQKIREADIFIWGGEVMTPQLSGIVKSRSKAQVTIDVSKLADIHLIKLTAEEAHHHDHNGEDNHDHDTEANHDYDPHIWLSPHNAIVIATALQQQLAAIDSENRERYQANLEAFIDETNALQLKIKEQLKPYQKKNYFVFHDAYRYFGEAFAMQAAGVVKTDPSKLSRSKSLLLLKQEIGDSDCLFIEPQFRQELVMQLVKNKLKIGTLDPIGYRQNADVNTPNVKGYSQILEDMASALAKCLGSDS